MAFDALAHEPVGSFAASLGETVADTKRRWEHGRAMQDRVRSFHKFYEGDVRDEPYEPTWNDLMHRDDLIMEEWDELHHELGRAKPDLVKIAHEAADLYIVLLGLAVELGFDLDKVAHVVTDANFTKDNAGPNRKPTKGERFVPADVRAVLYEQA